MSEYEVILTPSDYIYRVEAVVSCIKPNVGFNIKELKDCASRKVLVSSKFVSKVLHNLMLKDAVKKSGKKWYLTMDKSEVEELIRMRAV